MRARVRTHHTRAQGAPTRGTAQLGAPSPTCLTLAITPSMRTRSARCSAVRGAAIKPTRTLKQRAEARENSSRVFFLTHEPNWHRTNKGAAAMEADLQRQLLQCEAPARAE